MTPDYPVMSVKACVEYLGRNAWQFGHLGPDDSVRIRAEVARSCLFHLTPTEPSSRVAVDGDL